MRPPLLFAAGVAAGAVLGFLPMAAGHLHSLRHQAAGPRVRISNEFSFVANGPMERVAPLFGADKERVWASDWDPTFIYPLPAADRPGMVFTVPHGPITVPWINTEFDVKHGRVQYAYLIPGKLVTLITIRLAPDGERTRATVRYDRTALTADGDAHVRRLGDRDAVAGPEWEKSINDYLSAH